MSFLRHWKIAVSLLALFTVGMVTGAVLTVSVIKKRVQSQNDWPVMTYRLYKQRLNLTPEQEEKLKPTFTLAGEELRAVRRETMRDIFGVIRRVNVEVEKELTPEQKVEFDKLREEIRARMEKNKAGKGTTS